MREPLQFCCPGVRAAWYLLALLQAAVRALDECIQEASVSLQSMPLTVVSASHSQDIPLRGSSPRLMGAVIPVIENDMEMK